MTHVIIIADASSSISSRMMEGFKETLIEVFPSKGFSCTILTFNNNVNIVYMHQPYRPNLIEKMTCGTGLSNLYLAVQECNSIADKNKEPTVVIYIGDGDASDMVDITSKSSRYIKSKMALIVGKEPSNTILSDFIKYTMSEASLNQIKKDLAYLLK